MAASRGPLTRGAIASTAAPLLAREGAAAVTIRRLAEQLGVSPMAIYRHVADKNELLDLALDEIFSNVPEPRAAGGWDEVADRCHALRSHLLLNPGVIDLVFDRPTAVPNVLTGMNRMLQAIQASGVAPPDVVPTMDSLLMFVLGSVRWQVGRGATSSRAGRLAGGPHVGPVAEHARAIAERDPDEHFAFGLNRLLIGLRTAARPGARRSRSEPPQRRRPGAAGDLPS
jgi:AcrR family transcriptional regulator